MPLAIYEGFITASTFEGDDAFGIDNQFSWDSEDNNTNIADYEAAFFSQYQHGMMKDGDNVDNDAAAMSTSVGKKRKRGRPRLYLDPKAPRVFKHDIRRQYPAMFLNVMNSCDYTTFLSFFRTFASPDMIVQKKPISAEEIRKLPPGTSLPPLPIVPFRGSDWVRFHFLQASCFCADRIFRIENANITTRSDSQSSIIVLDVVNELTYLYAVDPITMIDAMLGLKIHPIPDDAEPLPEPAPSDSHLSDNFTKFFTTHHTRTDTPRAVNGEDGWSLADLHAFYCQQTGEFGIPLLREPERVTIRTQLTLHLSPSKHIVKIEIGDGKLSHAVGPTPRLWSKVRHLRWRSGP